MGDYLRSVIKNEKQEFSDSHIDEVKSTMQSGQLLDDQTIINVVKKVK